MSLKGGRQQHLQLQAAPCASSRTHVLQNAWYLNHNGSLPESFHRKRTHCWLNAKASIQRFTRVSRRLTSNINSDKQAFD